MRPVSLNRRRFIFLLSLGAVALAAACGSGSDQPKTPAPTSTPLVADRLPTALVPIPPTPPIDSTVVSSPTSQPGSPTATATRPTSTPSPFLPGAPTTAPSSSPSPGPEETPTPTAVVPVLESGKQLVNEPLGVLQLRPGIGGASTYSPGARAANFRINVGFSNPFHPDFSPWNYGVKFRDDGQTYQMFVFDHRGNLNQFNGNGNDLELVRAVAVPNLLTGGGARNNFTFLVIEERAFVLLDEVLIGIFDVQEPDRVGEISLVTDVFNQTTFVGSNTAFFNLVINSAGLIEPSSSGTLVRQQADKPAIGEQSLPSSATYTRITFVSPLNAFSGDYSFGLLFRTEAKGIDNWLVFDDSKAWRFIRRSTTGAEAVINQGTADQLGTRAGDTNFLEFLSTGEQHKIYLNGKFLANVSIARGDLPFTIAPMAAFEVTHQTGGVATEYRDLVVWSIAQ